MTNLIKTKNLLDKKQDAGFTTRYERVSITHKKSGPTHRLDWQSKHEKTCQHVLVLFDIFAVQTKGLNFFELTKYGCPCGPGSSKR